MIGGSAWTNVGPVTHMIGASERPEVAELRRRELEVPEQPALRRDPDLIAVVEPHPAVVGHRGGEHKRRDELEARQGGENGAVLEEDVDRSARLPGGGDRGASDRHVWCGSSGTRQRFSRSRRAARSTPRTRRARVPGSRRHYGAAGHSAWTCPTHRAVVARDLGDELGELADGDLLPSAEVRRLRAVVAFGRQDEPSAQSST